MSASEQGENNPKDLNLKVGLLAFWRDMFGQLSNQITQMVRFG